MTDFPTVYDDVAAEAAASAPPRRTTAQVAAEGYDGDNPGGLPSCGRGACWHWRNNVECPSDPWPMCEHCTDLAHPDLGGCPHGLTLCAEHTSACPDCETDAREARAELDRKYHLENGAA